MVFSSITFLFYFLPILLIIYFVAPGRFRNPVLLLASLFFYAWGEPVYILLMIASIIINYGAGLLIDKSRNSMPLILGIIANLLILGFFKYADFAVQTVNGLFHTGFTCPELSLPIGISFYTFQTMSYLIDLHKGRIKVQRNLLDFAVYVSLFPQLIAGPIVRLAIIQDALHSRKHSLEQFSSGVRRFIIGLAKKAIIANTIGTVWDQVSAGDLSQTPVLTAWLGIIAFTVQLYFDFSGYSDMAIGLGRMFGFEFPENFRYPYMSRSLTEFWRKWHITLGSWFREYVYIPLGGNRRGLALQLVNIAVVWMLTGLWHGASWNFVLWGLYFAVMLLLEKLFLLKILDRVPKFVPHLYTVVMMVISWVIFALDDVGSIAAYFAAMFGFSGAGFADSTSAYILLNNLLILIIAGIGATSAPAGLGRLIRGISVSGIREAAASLKPFNRNTIPLVWNKLTGEEAGPQLTRAGLIIENIWYAVLLISSVAFVTASTYNPFLYFRF